MDLLQVETPVLETSAGGADARPFMTFHNALQQPYALRIATGGHGHAVAGLAFMTASLINIFSAIMWMYSTEFYRSRALRLCVYMQSCI